MIEVRPAKSKKKQKIRQTNQKFMRLTALAMKLSGTALCKHL
ncbi:hypothetical protein [Bifidobacterium callitrichos]|nr:hypothetical protein [Bifidobacterium callitrichos]